MTDYTVCLQNVSSIEELVEFARHHLYGRGQFCGPQAIRWRLEEAGVSPFPSLSTIGRILRRRDLTHKRTGRYRPKGMPYPAPEVTRPNDVHQADFFGPRFIRTAKATRRFYVFNAVDLKTGRCAVEALTDGKRGHGCGYLGQLVAEADAFVGKPVAVMTKEDKTRAMQFLNEKGVFLIKKAGDKISKHYDISKYTLYNYMSAEE